MMSDGPPARPWFLLLPLATACAGTPAAPETAGHAATPPVHAPTIVAGGPAAEAAGSSAAATSLAGRWTGTLGKGAGALRLALTVTPRAGAAGAWDAVLDSLDQGASLGVDAIAASGTEVTFTIARIGGAYAGTLDAARGVLRGTWTQRGAVQALELTRGAPDAPPSVASKPVLLDSPLDAAVPAGPYVVRAQGVDRLVYELHLTNLSARPVTLRAVAIAGDEGVPLAQLEGDALAELVGRPDRPLAKGAERLELAAGVRAVVYAWIDLPARAPLAVVHRVTVAVDDQVKTTALPPLRIPRAAAPPLGPPLRGGDWVAGNGPSAASHHRRALVAIGGGAHIAQRFAIDFVRARGEATFEGDPSRNASYFAYGAEALAVADGVVAAGKDGLPENTPGGGGRAAPVTLETVGGNHVVIDLGHGRFAFYAHFQPGSLRVKVGERVRRGQVLGLVGNSGNSTEPHLHFHLMDGVAPLGAEGIPVAFTAFDARAAQPKEALFVRRTRETPLEDEVIRFAP